MKQMSEGVEFEVGEHYGSVVPSVHVHNGFCCGVQATEHHGGHGQTCALCLTREQRRAFKRRKPHNAWACCRTTVSHGKNPFGGSFLVRKRDLGKHAHAPQRGALDHATGTNFWPGDPSATRAVRRRMEGMPFFLRNETEPLRDLESLFVI